MLTVISILVVYTGPAASSNNHQPHSNHRPRSSKVEDDYDLDSVHRYRDQSQCILHMDSCSLTN
jgi:hypothetical protein